VDVDAERALMARARLDPSAFAELYRSHHAAIARYILRRVGDAHEAEDLVGDVFVSALQHLPRYRQRGLPVRAWLYRMATNRVNRWVRREGRRLQLHQQAPSNGEAADPLRHDGELQRARSALMSLPPKYQAVLALYYLEGLPVDEVALTLGCRAGTVKSRLARAREAMRRRLERRS
jgi:RNA polymerase sigma-70 factor (ECF subfamily)